MWTVGRHVSAWGRGGKRYSDVNGAQMLLSSSSPGSRSGFPCELCYWRRFTMWSFSYFLLSIKQLACECDDNNMILDGHLDPWLSKYNLM